MIKLKINIFENPHAVLVQTEWKDYKNIEWVNVEKEMDRPAFLFD